MIVYVISNCPRGIKGLGDHSGIIIKRVRAINFTTTLQVSSLEETSQSWLSLRSQMCVVPEQSARRQVEM